MIKSQLKISENKRFLANGDGSPFFWLADTAWEMLHCLTREEIESYMSLRARQGFNVLQTVILSEFDGLREPNAYGRVPLKTNASGNYDPIMPDLSEGYNCFDHLDFALSCAIKKDIYIALLPTWGDKYNKKWGTGPEIFTPENAYAYGEFLGGRYKEVPNIVWIMGGDRPLETEKHFEIVRSTALGIKAAGATHLMSFHPMVEKSSSEYVRGEDWLDFDMIQSSHGRAVSTTAEMITADYNRIPVKPVVDGECNYEDHPISFDSKNGWYDETDVRRASYWAVFSGAFGITYGHHSVWSMDSADRNPSKGNHVTRPTYFLKSMSDALEAAGAWQMAHLKNLILSKSFFDRVPANEILAERYSGSNLQCAVRGADYAMVYCPNGIKTTVDLSSFHGKVKISWFDPRTGDTIPFGNIESAGMESFTPPKSGRNNDYVLVIEKV